jgi:methylmalonyl-CoA mutase cobalamin-binding domain/chain
MTDRLQRMSQAIESLDERGVLALVEESLAAGMSSLAIVEAGERGMRAVGERYEEGSYFLSALIRAGEIFRQIIERTEPGLQSEMSGNASGRILLGTVAGDIHDIGKNLVALALRSFGFSVEDLGVDVPPARFLEEAERVRPDVVGLSGLVSASYANMRETVELLRSYASGKGLSIPVIIGGGTIDENVSRLVGADHWTNDTMEGVRICQRIVGG